MPHESMQLGDCRTLDEFFQRSLPLGLHESPRFMHLELEFINRCNLRCVMCYHSFGARAGTRDGAHDSGCFAANAARAAARHRLSCRSATSR